MKDKEIIITTDIKREKGYVYFVIFDKDDNIIVSRVKGGREIKDEPED